MAARLPREVAGQPAALHGTGASVAALPLSRCAASPWCTGGVAASTSVQAAAAAWLPNKPLQPTKPAGSAQNGRRLPAASPAGGVPTIPLVGFGAERHHRWAGLSL